MNKKKMILLLLVLSIFIIGMSSVSSVEATQKTLQIKNSQMGTHKYLGKGDYAGTVYIKGYDYQSGKYRYLEISLWSKYEDSPRYYKMTKAKVYYKKSNGKTVTRTYKTKYSYIGKVVPKGWTPKKAVIYYSKKSS